MFNVYLVVDLIVVIALIVLALAVLLKNASLKLNRIFAYFVTCVSIWIIAIYVSNDTHNPPKIAIVANYLVFAFSYGAAVYLLRFSLVLANDKKDNQLLRYLTLPFILIGVMALTPLVTADVSVQGSVYAVRFGPGAPLYFTTVALIIVATMVTLVRNIHRATGLTKKRLKVLANTLWLTLPLLLLAEFILPTATGWFGLSNIGILSMLILVFGLFYGVVRHKLFDLRLIIVRSLVYAITLGVISAAYGLLSSLLSNLVIQRTHNTTVADSLNAVLIITVALTYNPLKSVFNKVTNRFFYRDAYDSQVFIGQLNKVIVENIELDKLLTNVSQVIADNLKANYCLLSVKETQFRKERVIGKIQRSLDSKDLDQIHAHIAHLRDRVIVADLLPSSQAGLQNLLNKNDIAIIARITQTGQARTKSLGLIILGNKKSGNSYGNQDTTILDIISHELLIAIQNALRFEEIQNFNLTLQDKVNDATKKLRHANERLKALDETKDDFISMASHQLRTPLTSVKGYISMVLEGDAGKVSKTQREMLGQAFFSSQRMVYLIADLLNVSRLRTGKFVIEPSRVNLATMVQQELEQLKETAASRNLGLTYDQPKDFPDMMLDETKTRQVIMNFVDNAIYYTPSGGHIHVRLLNNPSTVELRVEDDGIGVAKTEQPHLFTKFYRAGNARKARPDGTGLGLFMAKKVIIAEGGSLIFESELGKGSTFGFVFSKNKSASAKTEA